MLRLAKVLIALKIIGLSFQAYAAMADTLDTIKARGELIVGTKVDYPPYGFRDKNGKIIGIEPELAADLAQRLGVKLRLEPVASSKRIQMLREGKIDILIATLAITDERKAEVGFVSPAYYASGIAALVSPKVTIQSEADLNGKSVCVIKDNFFNKNLKSLYVHKDLVVVNNVPEAEQALMQGLCTVFVFDDTFLLSLKKYNADTWKNYTLVQFTEQEPLPWGIAIRLEDQNSAYSNMISAAIVDWLRTGLLADLETKWLGRNTAWMAGIRERYKQQP